MRLAIILFLSVILLPKAWAQGPDYNLTGYKWNKTNLTWSLATPSISGPFSHFIKSGSEFEKAIKQALNQW